MNLRQKAKHYKKLYEACRYDHKPKGIHIEKKVDVLRFGKLIPFDVMEHFTAPEHIRQELYNQLGMYLFENGYVKGTTYREEYMNSYKYIYVVYVVKPEQEDEGKVMIDD